MSDVFGEYSRYYNLLYRDKDYCSETEFVLARLKRHGVCPSRILELGCGTGGHAAVLAGHGCHVTGVDLSEQMLAMGKHRLERMPEAIRGRLEFIQADLRTLDLGRRFETVLSLFHVFSYLNTNADLKATFQSAARHLSPKGLLFFDCWYGPGVLASPPTQRLKKLEDTELSVVRSARPVLHVERNLVDVNYHVEITERSTGRVRMLEETHPMRYLFQPEVELFLELAGLELLESGEWMTAKPADSTSWNAYFIARLRS